MAIIEYNDNFLRKAYQRYLIPTILAVLGGTVNVFFDGILVGQRFGAPGLAAVGLCSPIYLLLCTLGALIASGSSICSSWAIGRNDMAAGKRYYNTSLLLAVFVSLLFAAVGGVLIGPLARLLSGQGELYSMVYSYALITVLGGLPKVLLYVPFYYLRLDGKNKTVTWMTLLMTAINIGLDALFLFVLNWGVGGAALASVIASTVAVIIGMWALQQPDSNFRFQARFASLAECWTIIRTGTPTALNNLFSALRTLILNALMLASGGAALVSVFTVVNYISDFSWCIVSGIPQTASPIIGVFSSERNNAGIRVLMQRQIRAGLIAITIFGAAVTAGNQALAALFGVEGGLFYPILCAAVSLVAAQLNCIMVYYFNTVDRIFLANCITAGRVLVFAVIPAWLLAGAGQAMWLFLPISEVAALLLMVLLVRIISRRRQELSSWLLLNDELTLTGHVLDFSISSRKDDICDASARISDFCELNEMSPKQTMRISLAIEEIMTVMADKCFGGHEDGDFDVRAFSLSGTIGIRLRCAGNKYNPFEQAEQEDEEFGELLGVKIIASMAEHVQYQCIFGANTILILI